MMQQSQLCYIELCAAHNAAGCGLFRGCCWSFASLTDSASPCQLLIRNCAALSLNLPACAAAHCASAAADHDERQRVVSAPLTTPSACTQHGSSSSKDPGC